MSAKASPPERSEPGQRRPPVGLRARLWVGCLAGAVATALGAWWLIADPVLLSPPLDRARLSLALFTVAAASVLAGLVCLLWLDRGVIRHLRGVLRGMRSGRVADLRGLPSSGGWGELSLLTEQVQLLLGYQRQALRAAEELGALRQQLARVHEATARWAVTERLTRLESEPGVLAPLTESLNQSVQRLEELGQQHREVALQVRDELARAHGEARGGSEQSERTFVEATSLLTSVRELQRLTQELEAQLGGAAGAPAAGDLGQEAWRESCRAAIDELVAASAQSVEHLARGLMSVQEVADQVQVLGNRATLVALNVALATLRGSQAPAEVAELPLELKALVRDVRAAADRVATLTERVNQEVQEAVARMDGVRDKVAERLGAAPAPAPAPPEATARVMERVREMVQDAGQKGERLVSTAERTSRATERAVRALEESLSELDGLVARLKASAETPDLPALEPPPAGTRGEVESPGAVLRLLTPEQAPAEPAEPRGEEQP